MSRRTLPAPINRYIAGRRVVSMGCTPYLDHTILHVYVSVGGRWAYEAWVYNLYGEVIAAFSSDSYARRAISARYEIEHKLGEYAVRG